MALSPAQSRILLTAAAAAVLLAGGAAVLVIVRLTDAPRPRAAPETIAASPAPEARTGEPVPPQAGDPVPGPAEQPAPAAAPAPAETPAEERREPAAPEPPATASAEPPAWESVAVEAREATPGPVSAALGRGLGALQPALAECRGEEAARGPAGPPQEDERDRTGLLAAVLHLHVETLAEQLRIADAVVDDQGDASDELAACAQRVLRGQVVAAPGVQAGQRYRVLHALAR